MSLVFKNPIILSLNPIVQLATGPGGLFLYAENSVYFCGNAHCSLPGGFIIIEF